MILRIFMTYYNYIFNETYTSVNYESQGNQTIYLDHIKKYLNKKNEESHIKHEVGKLHVLCRHFIQILSTSFYYGILINLLSTSLVNHPPVQLVKILKYLLKVYIQRICKPRFSTEANLG